MSRLIAVALLALAGLAGCEKSSEELAKDVGHKVGTTAAEFGKGVGAGVDERISIRAELTPAAGELSLSMTTAKWVGPIEPPGKPTSTTSAPAATERQEQRKGIAVYLKAARPARARLVATALNSGGQEIGRATADVDFAADDAGYVTFGFPHEMDTQLVEKYVIDVQ
jgi:hypothetical protein